MNQTTPTATELRTALQQRIDAERAALQAWCDQTRRVLPAAARVLRELGAGQSWLFGSLAWGDVHAHSDIDIAVAGLPTGRRGEAEIALARLLGPRLELFWWEDLPADFAARIREDGEGL